MQKSAFFFTFHKCASSLFSEYALKHVAGLRHVDYASRLYTGEGCAVKFESTGCIYGPIRLSADRNSPVYRDLIIPASEPDFIRDKRAIFLIRDPRDILVSSYFSFGYSHGYSSVEQIQHQQKIRRARIQEQSLDAYALGSADSILENFELLSKLATVCQDRIILKYEDMIDNFDYFLVQLSSFLPLHADVAHELFARTRPRDAEDPLSHHRSGRVGQFRVKLRRETIRCLNRRLEHVLSEFSYESEERAGD